ncbi:transporter substrate-binding domain-containing protein [Halopseudomonas pachastrellae]|nr:transporter substrate-binding domain-containing protein [Halopseudomonas pachastrellae]
MLLTACEQSTQLEQIQEDGTLRVITRTRRPPSIRTATVIPGWNMNWPSALPTAWCGSGHAAADTVDSLYHQLGEADGPHVAAAGLTVNPARSEQIRFAVPYLDVIPQVVYRRGSRKPRSIEDLYDQRLMVLKGSTLADELRTLQQSHPELTFEESDSVEVVDLLRLVNDGEIDSAVVYSNELVVNQAFYPAVSVAFDWATASRWRGPCASTPTARCWMRSMASSRASRPTARWIN